MKKKKVIALLVLLVGIGVMVYAGAKLLEAQQVYQEGNLVYDDISSRVKGTGVIPPPPKTEESIAATPKVSIPQLRINFGELRAINKDAVAWLYCPDTVIDYPVMRASDYSYYLSHLADGSYNANGALFIDFNCASDFSDPLTVIYGHHMQSGRMFGSLVGYKNQAYFDEHPYMYLYTENGNYRIELLYGCVIEAGQWRSRAFMYPTNVESLLAYAQYNTTFNSPVRYQSGDRIVALSTCSYEFDDARYVVIGVLRSEY